MAAAGTAKRYAYTVVVERMCEQIRTGALLPGDRLPPERQLARELAVARTSVRQALQALAERAGLQGVAFTEILRMQHRNGREYPLFLMTARKP